MLDFSKNIELFINNKKYLFGHEVNYDIHPTNNSTITFNGVILEDWKEYPKIVNNIEYSKEFSIGEVKEDGKTVFFGIITDTGRLNIAKNEVKTFSVIITDFRVWLNLSKPINKIYRRISPNDLIIDYLKSLNNPRIQVGLLDFSTAGDFIIDAYNTNSKSPYSILKNVIERQTSSLLYFTLKDSIIYVNYKSLESINKDISTNNLDFNNEEELGSYKITKFEMDSDTHDYYNVLAYETNNATASTSIVESSLSMAEDKITLQKIPAKIDINKTFLLNIKTNKQRKPVILSSKNNNTGRIYDLLYSTSSKDLEVRAPNTNEVLTITYFPKDRLMLEVSNPKEIKRLANLTNTDGIVYKYEKYDDISSPNDLLSSVNSDLAKYSTPSKNLTIETHKYVWNILESVELKNLSDEVNGVYLVNSIKANGTPLLSTYTYTLTSKRHLNTIINKFDNQTFRDNAVPLEDENFDSVQSISYEFMIYTSLIENNIIDLDTSKTARLQTRLQAQLAPVGTKYKVAVV